MSNDSINFMHIEISRDFFFHISGTWIPSMPTGTSLRPRQQAHQLTMRETEVVRVD